MEKYSVYRYFNSYVEVEVEANDPEEAIKLARPELKNMSVKEFTRQLVANSEADPELGVYY